MHALQEMSTTTPVDELARAAALFERICSSALSHHKPSDIHYMRWALGENRALAEVLDAELASAEASVGGGEAMLQELRRLNRQHMDIAQKVLGF